MATPQQRILLLGKRRFDYYVDSLTGSDSNPGTSPQRPWKSFSRLNAMATVAGLSIGIAASSTFQEQLTLTGDRVTVDSYGVGSRPLLDCRDILPNAGWTKTAGRANVYQTTIALPGNGKIMGNVWSDGNFLHNVTSIALCDATAGTFYVSDWTAATATLYVNAIGSTVPGADGKVYRYSRREHGLLITGDYANVRNIHGFGNAHQDGSVKINGYYARLSYVRVEDGARHALYTKPGSYFYRCECVRGKNALEGDMANSLVVNDATVAGTSYITEENYYDGGTGGSAYTGPQNHGGDADELFGPITHIRPVYVNCYDGANIRSANTKIINPTYTNCQSAFSIGNAGCGVEIYGGTGSLNQLYTSAAGATIYSHDNSFTVPSLGTGFYRTDTSSGDVSLTVLNDTLNITGASGVNARIVHHQRGTISLTNLNIGPALCAPVDDIVVAGFTGGTASFVGNGNSYPFGSRFQLNGTTYNTFSPWQAAGNDVTSSLKGIPATVASDDFNRGDENLESSVNWSRIGGAAAMAGVRSNQLSTLGTTMTFYRRAVLASADHFIRFTVASVPATAGPYLVQRASDQNNWMGPRWTTTAWQVGKCIAGTVTASVVGSSTVAPAVGQDVICAIKGALLYFYINGRQVIRGSSFSAPELASFSGVGLVPRGALVNPFVDDFSCGLVG